MDGKIGSISVVACFQHFVGWVGIRVSVEYSSAMKGSAILMAFLVVVLVYCHPVQAQCPPILTRAQGAVSGELQDGDMLFLKFIYSRKRVESSSPQQPQGRTFTVTGAYSTFTRMNPLGGHVCSSAPHLIQLILRDRDGVTLDTVDLTAPDARNGVTEMNYGKTQAIVLHRRSVPPR